MHIHILQSDGEIGELEAFCREMIEESYSPAYAREAVGMFLRHHCRERIAACAAAGRIFVAREGGAVMGTATLADGELGRMFVSPRFRGRGVGAALMHEAMAYAREAGLVKVTAWSVPFSRGFYERFGFVMLNADTLDFNDTRDVPVPHMEMAAWPAGAPAVSVLPAGECDVEEMLEGQRTAFEEQCRLYEDWSIPPVTETAEEAARFLAEGGAALKAVAGGRIIGAVRGKVVEGVCQVGRLYVLPPWQGKSIARRLIAALEERMQPCARYSIFTGERSGRNIALYRRQGYAPTGRRSPAKAPGSDGNYDLVWLEKPNPWPEIAQCTRRFGLR